MATIEFPHLAFYRISSSAGKCEGFEVSLILTISVDIAGVNVTLIWTSEACWREITTDVSHMYTTNQHVYFQICH